MSTIEQIKVHQSQINLFENCGEAYRRRYIEGEIIPPGVAMLRGSGVHGGAEVNHRQKMKSGRDLPKKDIVDAAVSILEERKARDGFRLTREEMAVGVKPTIARTIETVQTLTGLYVDAVAPGLQPAMVEEKIVAEVSPEVALAGTIDVATVDGRVKDFKTTGKTKPQSEADTSLQFSQYGLLYRAKTGAFPSGFDMEQLVDLKTPKHVRLSTTRTQADYQVLVNRINTMLRAQKAGIFAPAAVGSWICSERWCGFWRTCPYVNSERAAAAAKIED